MVADFLDVEADSLRDSVFARFLKMRKWLILTGAALFLIHTGLLDFKKLAAALYIPEASRQDLHVALTVAGSYQAVMLFLVLVQLAATYHETMIARLRFQGGKIWLARRLQEKRRTIINENGLSETDLGKSLEQTTGALNELLIQIRNIDQQLPHARHLDRFVVMPEVTTDVMKIVPTVAFFLYALGMHGAWWPLTPSGPQSPPASVVQPQ